MNMKLSHAIFSVLLALETTFALGFDGIFDAGWSTAYYSQDSITKMHERLHNLGMTEIVLQYAAVKETHLYYPSELDFLQNTQYKNNQLFSKSIIAANETGNSLWFGLYYEGENWYTPPTETELDTLAIRNIKVLDELFYLYGTENVVKGVYIPQEIARYYWDGLRHDATPSMLATHFLIPVTRKAQEKGWKVIIAPFYNQHLEKPDTLEYFFKSLFAAGFKPEIIAVQDGIGANDAGKNHADISTVGNYERAIKNACEAYGIQFWVDAELFKNDNSQMLADSARFLAQMDTARSVGAFKVIGYDLAVLGNAGLDSLEKWKLESKVSPPDTGKTNIQINKQMNKRIIRTNTSFYRLDGSSVKKDKNHHLRVLITKKTL